MMKYTLTNLFANDQPLLEAHVSIFMIKNDEHASIGGINVPLLEASVPLLEARYKSKRFSMRKRNNNSFS
jgi:hypothetical protein